MKGGIAVTILDAVIQGIIGALAEFLPISGSGHLAVLRNLFNINGGTEHLLLDAMIHIGAVIAMLFMSWSEIKRMLKETSSVLYGTSRKKRSSSTGEGVSARLLMLVLAASVPLLLMIPLGGYLLKLSQEMFFVGAMLILNGAILVLYPKFVVSETKNEKTASFANAFVVGFCQCVALIPGLSRTAIIMTSTAASATSRSYSVRFALLCSVPAMLGMALYEMVLAATNGIDPSAIPAYIIAMVCSMLISVLAIGIMRVLAKRNSFGGFSYYCLIIGVLTVILSTIF